LISSTFILSKLESAPRNIILRLLVYLESLLVLLLSLNYSVVRTLPFLLWMGCLMKLEEQTCFRFFIFLSCIRFYWKIYCPCTSNKKKKHDIKKKKVKYVFSLWTL